MKKHFFVWLFLVISIGYAQGQKPKKASLTKADIYFQSAQLDRAKEEIDRLMQHPKKGKRLNAYLLHAKIYRAILLSDNFIYRELSDQAGVIAAKSFEKVMKMQENRKKSPPYIEAFNAFEELWGHQLQQAINHYKIEDYSSAYDEFLVTLQIKPQDSLSLYYAGYVARLNKAYDQTLLHYHLLIDLGKAPSDVYKIVINLERVHKKNLKKALSVAQKGRTLFGDDPFFRKEEMIILIQQGNEEQIRSALDQIVEADVKDAELFLFLASFYESKADPFVQKKDFEGATSYLDTAIVYYRQSLDLSKDQVIAHFNIALAYRNMAQQHYQKLQAMDQLTYEKEGASIEEKGKEIMLKSLPHLEQAYALDSTDIDVVTALQQVYYLIGMKKKEEEYTEKLKALEASNPLDDQQLEK